MIALLKKHTGILICLIIVVAILSVYYQVGGFAFVSFDDGLYVFENLNVRSGISMQNVCWAFGFTGIAYWHPLTWLSHMLDCQLFELNAGWHHLMNLVFHACSSLLLYYVFRRMTGDVWKSAVIALLFGLHPINVESVAWVSERKNVLSTFLWMLTLLSYSFYVARAHAGRYLLTLLCFVLGLLAKPAIVTLPFVLLLLDFWPLRRLRIPSSLTENSSRSWADFKSWVEKSNIYPLILEKIPFFLLSGISIYISYLSSRQHGIVVTTGEVPIQLRLANGLVSYVVYFWKMIWPQNLAVFYPYPDEIPVGMAMAAGTGVLCVSVIILRWSRRLPYLAVGWFWYLGTLVPYIGLMQAGLWPALADRWAYIAFIGLFIMITWGMPDLLGRRPYAKYVLPIVTVGTVFIFMAITWIQIGYWKNNIALYQHTVNVTPNNDVAHNNLGAAYFDAGSVDQAIFHFVEALKIQPGYAAAHRNLNKALDARADTNAAIENMHQLIKANSGIAALHYNLGNLYRNNGQYDKAILQYRQALVHRPGFVQAINNQAGIYIALSDYSKAARLLNQIAALQPDDVDIHIDLARVYAKQGRVKASIAELQIAIEKGFSERPLLHNDPHLKLLQETTAYKNFLKKIE